VPDNVVYLDSDESSDTDTESGESTIDGESDVEIGNVVRENLEDLRIDMRARYKYNERVLGRWRGG
jgi:hypothetical protein